LPEIVELSDSSKTLGKSGGWETAETAKAFYLALDQQSFSWHSWKIIPQMEKLNEELTPVFQNSSPIVLMPR